MVWNFPSSVLFVAGSKLTFGWCWFGVTYLNSISQVSSNFCWSYGTYPSVFGLFFFLTMWRLMEMFVWREYADSPITYNNNERFIDLPNRHFLNSCRLSLNEFSCYLGIFENKLKQNPVRVSREPANLEITYCLYLWCFFFFFKLFLHLYTNSLTVLPFLQRTTQGQVLSPAPVLIVRTFLSRWDKSRTFVNGDFPFTFLVLYLDIIEFFIGVVAILTFAWSWVIYCQRYDSAWKSPACWFIEIPIFCI